MLINLIHVYNAELTAPHVVTLMIVLFVKMDIVYKMVNALLVHHLVLHVTKI